jgi:hypothetical protein
VLEVLSAEDEVNFEVDDNLLAEEVESTSSETIDSLDTLFASTTAPPEQAARRKASETRIAFE